MGLFQILRLEHAAIQDSLDEVIEAQSKTATEALHHLQAMLIAHDRAEEAVFYETLAAIPHRTELAEVKSEEHQLIESLLVELIQTRPHDRSGLLELLKSQLEAHIAEEETNVFGIAESFIDEELSEKLGQKFELLRDRLWEELAGGGPASAPHPLAKYKSKNVYRGMSGRAGPPRITKA